MHANLIHVFTAEGDHEKKIFQPMLGIVGIGKPVLPEKIEEKTRGRRKCENKGVGG